MRSWTGGFEVLAGGAGGGVGAGVFVVAELNVVRWGLVWACGRVRVWGARASR